MKQSEKVIFVLKKKDCSFEEIKKETKIGFFDLQKTIKELLKEEKIFKSGFPTKYSLEKKKHSVMGFTQLKESINPLLKYKEIFLIVTIALILLLVYSVFFKNPFLFPGLEQRTLLALTPLLIITLLLYVPWLKIASFLPTEIISDKVFVHLENAKKIANLVELKKYLKETNKQIIIPYYPHFLIIISVISLLEMPLLKPLNDFFSPIALILIIISVILIILKQKNYSFFKEKNLVKYSFLFLLILVTISSLKFEFLEFIAKPLLEIQFQLTIFTIFLGAITFYQNRSVIEEIEEEQSLEEKEEQKRALEFDKKYPTLARVPVGKHIFKWVYKEGWVYVAILVLILVIFISLSTYININNPTLGDDEFPTYYSSLNLFELSSGNSYYRGASFQIILNLFSNLTHNFHLLRSLNILFFLTLAIFIYKLNINKELRLLFLFLISVSPIIIAWSAEIRHYFIFIILVFFLLSNSRKFFILPLIILIFFTSEFSLIVISVFICLLIMEFFLKKKFQRLFFIFFISTFVLFFGNKIYFILSYILTDKYFTVLSPNFNTAYMHFFLNYFIFEFILFSVLMINVLNLNNKKIERHLYFSLLCFILISAFLGWNQPKYILFIFPSLIFLVSYFILFFKKITIFKKKNIFLFLFLFIFTLNLPNFANFGMVHPEYNFEPIENKITNNTIIITTNQYVTYYFLNENKLNPKKVYWLRRDSALEPGYLVNGKDFWVGYEHLSKFNMLFDEKTFDNIIIIGDRRLFSRTYVDTETQNFIKNNLSNISKKGDYLTFFEFISK